MSALRSPGCCRQPKFDHLGVRQVLERFAAEGGHHVLAFVLAQLVRRARRAPLARHALIAPRIVLHAASAAYCGMTVLPDDMPRSGGRRRCRPDRSGSSGFGAAGRTSCVRAFQQRLEVFCGTSKAATSATALSLRRSWCWSCSCWRCSSRNSPGGLA